MSLPTAIASGADAETPSVVSPVRAGIGAAVLALVLVVVTYLYVPVPGRVLSLIGADGEGLGRHGGARVAWSPPPGVSPASVLAGLDRGDSSVRVDGDALVIEIPGVVQEDVAYTAKLLVAGGVTFHRTFERVMASLPEDFGVPMDDGELVTSAGVLLAEDHWQPEDGGSRHLDHYLYAARREQIEALLATLHEHGWRLPDGAMVAYEHLATPAGSGYVRTHVIERAPAISGERIAKAVGTYDANTNRPLVLLDFDRQGTDEFGRLTQEIVGQKLATVVGDEVRSAPIINGAILGGRASITMGGTDARAQEQERDALVALLQSSPLPPGGALRSATYVAPTTTGAHEWLARGLLGLGAGALVGLVVFAVVRRTRPVHRTYAAPAGKLAWWRVLVTLLAPIVVFLANQIDAPGLDGVTLYHIAGGGSQFSLGMFGVTPLISAYLLVELVATIVPSWRRRRHAGSVARLPFDVAAIGLGIAFTMAQAWFTASYLDKAGVGPSGFDLLLYLVSMGAMTVVYVLVATFIRTHGLGNGYATLLASVVIVGLIQLLVFGPEEAVYATAPATDDIVLGLVSLVVFALAMTAVLRWRIAGPAEPALRVPTSGSAPLGQVESILALVFIAAGSLLPATLGLQLADAQHWVRELHRGVALVLVAAFAVLWSWAFARPAALRVYAERAKLAPPSWETWRRATLLSIGVLVVLSGGYLLMEAVRPGSSSTFGVLTAMVVGAVVLDLVADLRGRRGDLVRVWALGSAQHADLAAHALSAADIRFHVSGANARTLFAWFGPFIPIDVHVPREHALRAHEILAGVFAPADPRTSVSTAPVTDAA